MQAGVKSCKSSRAYSPASLSIFHLKNLGPLATEHITALYNDSLKSYSFRPRQLTTSSLLQRTTDIKTGFNQWKPPHRTVCMAINLTATFDTVSHDILISKIAVSSLPPAITRWMSCYLKGRQAATSIRGPKSNLRIARTGVPQESKLSPSLFNYYIADMPRPTYANDITVWASGLKIPQLESIIISYLRDVSIYLRVNSLYYVQSSIRLSRPGMRIYYPFVWNMRHPENEALKS